MAERDYRIPTAIVIGCVVVLGLLIFLTRGYGEMSPKGYEYATALYSICNRKDEPRLTELEKLVTTSLDQSELVEAEARWLLDIAKQARSGDWDAALSETRRLMEDQVTGG